MDRVAIPAAASAAGFGFVAAAIAALTFANDASAKVSCPAGFPSKPIRFVVGFGAGGGTDVIARAVATGMERLQGWVVPVENRPGAGGGVVAQWLKVQPADGYTIGSTSSVAVTINPALGNADYVWSDFDYLGSGMQTWSGFRCARRQALQQHRRVRRIRAQERPWRRFRSPAPTWRRSSSSSPPNTTSISSAVPRRRASEGLGDRAWRPCRCDHAGHAACRGVKTGKVKQLASLVDRRVPYAPNSQTMAEQGTNVPVLDSLRSFFLPKGVPAGIQKCLAEAVEESIKTPEYNDLMTKFDNEALNLGPERHQAGP